MSAKGTVGTTSARKNGTAPLSPTTLSFVGGVVFLGVFCTALLLLGERFPQPRTVLMWMVAFLASEVMRFRTPTGKGNVSMASTIHLAAVPILGLSGLLPAVWVSRLAAEPV